MIAGKFGRIALKRNMHIYKTDFIVAVFRIRIRKFFSSGIGYNLRVKNAGVDTERQIYDIGKSV